MTPNNQERAESIWVTSEQGGNQWRWTVEGGLGPRYAAGSPAEGTVKALELWTKHNKATDEEELPDWRVNHTRLMVWDGLDGGGGDSEEEEQPETQNSDDGAWPRPLSLQRSWDIQLFLGDLPSAAFSFQGSAVFSSGPVSPLGSLKLSGSSTPTPTFLPPPLPQLLQTLPEVCLPGDPGLPLLLLCGERICCFLVDRNRFNFQGSELIRIWKNNRMNADVGETFRGGRTRPKHLKSTLRD